MSEADEDMNTSVNGDRFVEHIKLLHGQQLKTQTKTFTKWMNSHLRQHEPPLTVEDLFKDIKDGTRLLGLLEVLSGERLVGERGANMKRIHFLTNVNQALNFLQSKNIKLVNINTGDVVDGRPAVVLGLIWTIILYFHIEKGTRELLERKRADSVLAPVDGVAESEKQTKEEEVKSAPAPNVGARATLLSWASDAMERYVLSQENVKNAEEEEMVKDENEEEIVKEEIEAADEIVTAGGSDSSVTPSTSWQETLLSWIFAEIKADEDNERSLGEF
ncbi:PREDICTED: alpha-actinin-4-like [Priapulus caudatus]|uniref:Alpha-actinin-4-like n=1 Tax=Priapulus caudatus TaxID=37621 RepID=A0ABM1EJ44_PRICU|nr:PREDICTED: alpha-actinin-4-like [Priapulus caudatus]